MIDLELFWLALGFYTRLPGPRNLPYERLPQAGILLPLIGWLVGGLTGLSYIVASQIWGQTTSILLAMSAGILITGAFHEDGFADVCDGFGGGYGKERILEIMKDSRIGVYGALGVFLLMALKAGALSELPSASIPFALLSGHSLSRCAPLLLMHCYDYARTDQSKSAAAVLKPDLRQLAIAAVIGLLPLLLLPWRVILLTPALFLMVLYLGRYFHRYIGGYTGDCLGASQQVTETLYYLGVSALWTST